MKYRELLSSSVKRLRESNDLTQDLFGEKIGLSVEAVRNIEQGKFTPTAKTIDAICEAFDITPFELLIPPTPQDSQKIILHIIQKLKLLDNSKLKFISGVIDLMK